MSATYASIRSVPVTGIMYLRACTDGCIDKKDKATLLFMLETPGSQDVISKEAAGQIFKTNCITPPNEYASQSPELQWVEFVSECEKDAESIRQEGLREDQDFLLKDVPF